MSKAFILFPIPMQPPSQVILDTGPLVLLVLSRFYEGTASVLDDGLVRNYTQDQLNRLETALERAHNVIFLSAIACNSRWDLGTTPREQPLVVQEQGGTARYVRGNCTVEEIISDSTVSISLDLWYSPMDCHNIVTGINKILSAHCTEDPDAVPWI